MVSREQMTDITTVVTQAVNQTDPMGLLSMGAPDDEYEPEIRELVARLGDAWPDPTAVLRLCESVFSQFFGARSVDARRMKRLAARIVMGLRELQQAQTRAKHARTPEDA